MVSTTVNVLAAAVAVLLVTVIVYVIVLFTITGFGDADFVMARSAQPAAECGPGLESNVTPLVITPVPPDVAP